MPGRILVIEDNAANLDLMELILTSFGHELVRASDGLAGLDEARRGGFDLIISDILMPGIDGYEFARQAKADPMLKDVPVVAVTALAMVGDKEKVLAAGFQGYVSKPIDPRTFAQDVDAFMPEGRKSGAALEPDRTAHAQSAAALSGPLVLAIDDTAHNLEFISRSLGAFGYRVVVARSVDEGLERARQAQPAAILCDMTLPGKTGVDMLREAKADERIRHIPVIMLWSSVVTEERRAYAVQLGAADLIQRPIDIDELVARLGACLKLADASRRARTGMDGPR